MSDKNTIELLTRFIEAEQGFVHHDDPNSSFNSTLASFEPDKRLRDNWLVRLLNDGYITADVMKDATGEIKLFKFKDVTSKGRGLVVAANEQIEDRSGSTGSNVFIVHGHNELYKAEVARLIEKQGLTATILHEKPDGGKTIIEKFEEEASSSSFAVVILSGDDEGSQKDCIETELRARQNVVFEFGYFVGKLGRSQVCALLEDKVTMPSDLDGVLYKKLNDGWESELLREMKAAGLEIDLNLS